jgi:hypothetical protein
MSETIAAEAGRAAELNIANVRFAEFIPGERGSSVFRFIR